MDCKEAQGLMSACIDREADASDAARYEVHLAGCAACSDAHRQMLELHTAIKTHGIRYAAPAHLRQRIKAALPAAKPRGSKLARLPWAWINFGFATACSAVLAVTLSLYMAVPSEEERFAQEVVASHARSLMANHLADVASSDQHTVKPWFTGKLDFSPAVVDLAQQGFALIGGRLDYMAQRPVAALAYRHRQHVVNLFVWPDTMHGDTAQQLTSRQGYQLMHWTQDGMRYEAISDMNARDLSEFKRLLVSQIAGEGKQ